MVGISLIILCAALLLLGLARRALLVITVEGESMAPMLAHGARVLALCWHPRRQLRRGQIAIVAPQPGATASGTRQLYIKRIVALPGDLVESTLAEIDPALRPALRHAYDADGQRRWRIPPGHCFVQGDAPLGSVDSRLWGPLPLSAVQGVMIARLPGRASAAIALAGDDELMLGLAAGTPAPALSAQTLDGTTLSLAAYAGRQVALIIFSPLEPESRDLLLEAAELALQAQRHGVALLLVSLAGAEQTRPLVEGLGSELPLLLAPKHEHRFIQDYRVTGWPCFCLIDEHGLVRSSGFPAREWGEWHELAEAWAREPLPSSQEPSTQQSPALLDAALLAHGPSRALGAGLPATPAAPLTGAALDG